MEFLTAHEIEVIRAATARLVPGPTDDPAEMGSPGAREADVAGYIDRLLGSPDSGIARVYAGGPWSPRAVGVTGLPMRFVPLTRAQHAGWSRRLAELRGRYRAGIATLDAVAGGDFACVAPERQDEVLCHPSVVGFRDLLFDHTVEGMFALPEYGGNRDTEGWRSIGYPGDRQPGGYSAAEVELPGDPDPVPPSAAVDRLLARHDRAVSVALSDADD